MVRLQLVQTDSYILENTVVVNPNAEGLKDCSEVTVTKTNGTSYQFHLMVSSRIPTGAFHIGRIDSRRCRFHKWNDYRVEAVKSSAVFETEQEAVDFSKMKIAGYSSTIKLIVEEVFAPRTFSPELCEQLDIQFIRGVILHGLPGTGKTSLIKSLCEYFNLQPKIIRGPELLNPMLGKSEEALRSLFTAAIQDQEEKGNSSPLHVLVFDNMDALFSNRKSTDGVSATRSSLTSQLRTIMDGFKQLNNILIFGTTDRLDMIDPGLLRGGRFELIIKLDLPTAEDRLKIINFHLKKPQDNGRLASDVTMANLQRLANSTEKFSGADLSQIIGIATTEASSRLVKEPIINLEKLTAAEEENAVLKWDDLVYGYHLVQHLRQERAKTVEPKDNNDSEE